MKFTLFTSKFHIPVSNPKPKPTKSKIQTFFTDPCFVFVRYLTKAASALVMPLWDTHNHYLGLGVANMQRHAVVIPQSTFGFMISFMVAFAGIKSQCLPGFPFKTNLHLVRFSISMVLMYGFACAAELVVSATSVFVIVARLGKTVCLCVLVISLACLLYL